MLTLIIGVVYMTCFLVFLDPILRMFGASDASLPYAREFMQWIIPGMVLINLTFSYNNVMRATGYPRKAMLTNILGAVLNAILAPLFLFGFGWGIWGRLLPRTLPWLSRLYMSCRIFQSGECPGLPSRRVPVAVACGQIYSDDRHGAVSDKSGCSGYKCRHE